MHQSMLIKPKGNEVGYTQGDLTFWAILVSKFNSLIRGKGVTSNTPFAGVHLFLFKMILEIRLSQHLTKLWWGEVIWINWNQPRGKIFGKKTKQKKKQKSKIKTIKKKEESFLLWELNPRPLICKIIALAIAPRQQVFNTCEINYL